MTAGVPDRTRQTGSLRRHLLAITAVLVLAIVGYLLFPNNLALLTRIIAVSLLVLSLDLVTGYCGVATLGQAALFGAGAYAAGIGSAHFGVSDPIAMTAVGMLAGAVSGLLCGVVMLRGAGLTQLVLSIALLQLFHELANKATSWTGGSDGLSGIAPEPLLGVFAFDLWGRTAYVYGVILLVLVLIVLVVLVRSPFGMLARAVRDDAVRVSAMGASSGAVIVRMYGVAGAVAGIGGALSAISTQVVGLDSLSFALSAEALVMLVLGGVGSLYGALAGTVVFMLFEDYVSAANPFHWLTLVGLLLIAVVLFAPKGLLGAVLSLPGRRRSAR